MNSLAFAFVLQPLPRPLTFSSCWQPNTVTISHFEFASLLVFAHSSRLLVSLCVLSRLVHCSYVFIHARCLCLFVRYSFQFTQFKSLILSLKLGIRILIPSFSMQAKTLW